MHREARKNETRDAGHVRIRRISRVPNLVSRVSTPTMRLTRIYTPGPLAADTNISLTPSGANHVVRVLRLRVGDEIGVFDGDGNEFRATIESVKGSRVIVRIGETVPTENDSSMHITLIQGVSRGERMDWVVQKATELGVVSIVPVITARSVVKLDRAQSAKKQEHWRSIAIGACEQCGRARIPEIATPISLQEYLRAIPDDSGNGDTPHFASHFEIVLDPTASQSLASMASGNGECPHFRLLIGPEGGLDDDELAAALRAGFISLKLGPRILRTETAAVAAIAVLQAKWGDLR